MDTAIFADIFSKIILVLVISGVFLISKRVKVVYEVLLVLAGIVLACGLFFVDPDLVPYFRLDPEILLFGFLPMLLLEIAHTMPYKDIIRNIRPISVLAIVSPVVSAVTIGALLHVASGWIWQEIPLLITLLFGTIMSSTDPVTVLSIFKKLGAPQRLILLFEGESLFNDGASLALFFLVLSWIVGTGEHITLLDTAISAIFWENRIIESIVSFTSMIAWGALLGIISGMLFSKILGILKRHQFLAILAIITSAYSCYLVTELVHTYLFPASAIIATIFSTFIIGNYGRYKIDLKTEDLAQSVFSFIAFLINSTIFLLVGASILSVKPEIAMASIGVAAVAVAAVVIGRAISVYLPIRAVNRSLPRSDRIPAAWQHILAWGSLRGGLALALVWSIPTDLSVSVGSVTISVQDLLFFLVICSVFFSIFIKTLSLEWMARLLGLNDRSIIEQIEEEEAKLVTIAGMLSNIDRLHSERYLSDTEHTSLGSIYRERQQSILSDCRRLHDTVPEHSSFLKIVSLYALALERSFAKELYMHGDIAEKSLKRFLAVIDLQSHRLRSGKTQVREVFDESYKNDFFERLEAWLARIVNPDPSPDFTEYAVLRGRVMILDQTLEGLEPLRPLAQALGREADYDRVCRLYRTFREKALIKRRIFEDLHSDTVPLWHEAVLRRTFKRIEESVIENLSQKGLVSERFRHILRVGESDFQSFFERYGQ